MQHLLENKQVYVTDKPLFFQQGDEFVRRYQAVDLVPIPAERLRSHKIPGCDVKLGLKRCV